MTVICRGFGEDFNIENVNNKKTVEVSHFEGDKLWTLVFKYTKTENKKKVYEFNHKE